MAISGYRDESANALTHRSLPLPTGRVRRGGQHGKGMPRDHQVLVSRDDADHAPTVRPAHRVGMGRVALGVEPEPEVLEPLASLPTDGGGPLADAAGEDEQVEPAQRRREG